MTVKNQLIKIAYENPEIRGDLLPIITGLEKEAGSGLLSGIKEKLFKMFKKTEHTSKAEGGMKEKFEVELKKDSFEDKLKKLSPNGLKAYEKAVDEADLRRRHEGGAGFIIIDPEKFMAIE